QIGRSTITAQEQHFRMVIAAPVAAEMALNRAIDRPRGTADKQAMAIEELAACDDSIALRDDHHVVNPGMLEKRRRDAGAQSRDMPLLRSLPENHGALGVHGDDANRWVPFLETRRDAGHGSR